MRNLGIGLTIVCLTLCLYVLAQAEAEPSLVLYFDFEGGQRDTVEDRSIYGNNGNIQGGAKWVDGKFGKGLEIDRSSFVLVPDCDEFNITDEVTLGCWAKFRAFAPEAWQGNSLDFLVCRWNWDQGNNRCYEVFLESHFPVMTVSSDGTDAGATQAVAGEPVELDKWYSIVGVFDGSEVRTYVDGEEAGLAGYEGKIFDGEGPIVIGDNNFGALADFHFVGVIDEVFVYNRALKQSEIKERITSGHIAATVESKGKLATIWGDVKVQH